MDRSVLDLLCFKRFLAMTGTETIDPGLEEKELTELLSELYAKVRCPQFLYSAFC